MHAFLFFAWPVEFAMLVACVVGALPHTEHTLVPSPLFAREGGGGGGLSFVATHSIRATHKTLHASWTLGALGMGGIGGLGWGQGLDSVQAL